MFTMYYPPTVRAHRYFRPALQRVFMHAYPPNGVMNGTNCITYHDAQGEHTVSLWSAMEAAAESGVAPLVPPGTSKGIAEYNWHQYVRACYHDRHVCDSKCAPGYAPGTRP